MTRLNKAGDVSFIKDCKNWVEVYNQVKNTWVMQTSGLRYRANMEDSLHEFHIVNNLIHFNINKVWFS